MTRDDESFLGRWSRLKKQARAEEGPPAPKPDAPATARVSGVPPSAPVPPGVAAPASAVSRSTEAPALPSLESLKGLASEYTEFLKPGVDENLRRSALKKLFSDP